MTGMIIIAGLSFYAICIIMIYENRIKSQFIDQELIIGLIIIFLMSFTCIFINGILTMFNVI